MEIIRLNCNNFENELVEDLRNIDNKQIHLQNRINELENAFTVASNTAQASQQWTDFDGEQTCSELHEKVRVNNGFTVVYQFELKSTRTSSQVLELERKLHNIQLNASRCADCQLICSKMHVFREKIWIILNDRRHQMQELADTK